MHDLSDCETIVATDGLKALEVLRSKQTIHMVFSDGKMPNMDGIELLGQVQKHWKHIPFCIVSGYIQKSEADLLKLGAVGYISKPYSIDTILAMVEKHLGDSTLELSNQLLPTPLRPLICVLEDDPVDQSLLRRALTQHLDLERSYELIFFPDGQALLTALKSLLSFQKNPQLLIFDINVPGISGLETLGLIRKENLLPPHTPVIMLSSSNLASDRERSQQLGANSYITKPDSLDQWWHLARSVHQSWLPRPTGKKAG